jgi:SHS2 domain-containing protein
VTYQYLPEIATADVAFLASGDTLNELFISAGDALMNVMVDDLSTIANREEIEIDLSHEELDLLLFSFLNELVYFKDARLLLLRASEALVTKEGSRFILHATLYGEQLNPEKHHPAVDVKAVTLHLFRVEEKDAGWEAQVILDI